MVTNPFIDSVDKDKRVLARGQIDWLKVRLEADDGAALLPDGDWKTISYKDATNPVFKVTDPDGADVTDDFITLDLDPADSADTYDANHANYVGADASPANTGLFWDGANHVALKVKVPNDAEITANQDNRAYTISWKIKRGGSGQFLTGSEIFNIAEAGVLVFGASVITTSEVTQAYSTNATTSVIAGLIQEAADAIEGLLSGIGQTVPNPVPKSIKTATLAGARYLLLDWEQSRFDTADSATQGTFTAQIQSVESRKKNQEDRMMKQLEAFLNSKGLYAWKRPKVFVLRKFDGQGDFPRNVPWFFRDA